MTTSDAASYPDLDRQHCRSCRRLLFRMQHRALRAAHVIEIRCRCGELNYFTGGPST
jgi:hypothetical protein